MSIEKVKTLLEQLQIELKNSKHEVDTETKDKLQHMDANIHQILNTDNLQQQDIYDGIMQMEYSFLTKYPVASNIMREMMDIMSKAGI
ncbi:hypothetical protein MNBD_GAMMA01-469 [hydrothermal vent metagenome]|uniref:DUF4404 domain-containing protein n=1 Tax=hydrothermal vent metagenome TaxID=652676 RepID=A0A3B0V499_9ZZZZ